MKNLRIKIALNHLVVFIIAPLLLGVGPLFIQTAHGAQLLERSMMISNSDPGQVAEYTVTFSIADDSVDLGSMKFEFCSNTALFDVVCSAPAGFDITAATLSSQTGTNGFIIDPATTANELILSRPAGPQPVGQVSFVLSDVQNASNEGSQYSRFSTFQTSDASGLATDSGSVAYSINPNLALNTEVPPYLIVCLGITISGTDCSTAQGSYVNMGQFSTQRASTGQTQVVVATNASSGYVLFVSGATMTSGNNVIQPNATPIPSNPGNSQFGLNAVANSNPGSGENPTGPGAGVPTNDYGQSNRFKFSSGDAIASQNSTADFKKFTISYLVNISKDQPFGLYSSSFTYTGVGNF